MGTANYVEPPTKMVKSWKQFLARGPPPPIGMALSIIQVDYHSKGSFKCDIIKCHYFSSKMS